MAAPSAIHAATYEVGAGQTYTTIAGIPALSPGDVVNIHCGFYNEVRQWTSSGTPASPIVLQGVCATGRPVIDGANQDTSGNGSAPRGVWEIQGSNYQIRNLEFRDAHNGNNAAGIRVMNANVTISNCLMDYNDMGIMTSTDNTDNLLLTNSEIAFNGTGAQDGESHNLYLGAGITLTVSYCYIHDSVSGENVKSRAHYTQLFYNFIAYGAESEVEGLDSTDTTAANSNMVMIGNILVSTPNRTVNDTKFINFGQDLGGSHAGTLYLINNTLIAGATSIGFLRSSASNSAIVAVNNVFYGSSTIVNPTYANAISGANNWFQTGANIPSGFSASVTGSDPGLTGIAQGNFVPTSGSGVRNIGVVNPAYQDGSGVSHSGVPLLEYVHPLSSTTRPADTGMDAGAYGFGATSGGTPDLTIAETHSGSFSAGLTGTFTITASNVGTAATTGSVSVTDSLPAGLTATSISGNGWTCGLSPLACNRADALPAGQSYPAITLTVTVAANPPVNFTNTVTVSGGGETSTGNDSYSDTITVTGGIPTGTASFLKTDTTTVGSWIGVYGSDGAAIMDDAIHYPSYVVVTPGSNLDYLWTSATADPRALQEIAPLTGRIASCWYSATSFTVDLNFTDSASHQVALYLMDWDGYNGGRNERIDIVDANGAVLDTRSVSAFSGGEYLVWNLSGHVVVRVTNNNSRSNALINGIFFGGQSTSTGPAGAATFLKTDSTTQGNWKGVYGGDGANVIGDASVYPSYVAVTAASNSTWVWTTSTSDPRALQKESSSSGRVSACWYSYGGFTIHLAFNDTSTHQVALYLLDWDGDGGGRTQRVDVVDANNNILDTRNAASFGSGIYLVWNLSGNVTIRFTPTNPRSNAIATGLFFGPAGSSASPGTSSAAFLRTDTTTQGTWKGVYGADGANVIGDAASYPSYVGVNPSGNSTWVWTASTTDNRALQKESSGSGRIAACWYSYTSFTINLTFGDTNTHQVALYLEDWDNYGGGRTERIDIFDSHNNLLDTRTAANFSAGQYLVWNITGPVSIRVTGTNSNANAVVNGLFFR